MMKVAEGKVSSATLTFYNIRQGITPNGELHTMKRPFLYSSMLAHF